MGFSNVANEKIADRKHVTLQDLVSSPIIHTRVRSYKLVGHKPSGGKSAWYCVVWSSQRKNKDMKTKEKGSSLVGTTVKTTSISYNTRSSERNNAASFSYSTAISWGWSSIAFPSPLALWKSDGLYRVNKEALQPVTLRRLHVRASARWSGWHHQTLVDGIWGTS